MLSSGKSFVCSGLKMSAVPAKNTIPNLELRSSEIGKFAVSKMSLMGGSDGLQSVSMRAQFSPAEQKGEGEAQESQDGENPHTEVIAAGVIGAGEAVSIGPSD